MKPLIVEELIKANAGYDEAELIEELWECYVRFKADNDRSGTVGTDRDRILRIEALLREDGERR